MHLKSSGAPSTRHKYVDSSWERGLQEPEETGESKDDGGVAGGGGERYCAGTRHDVSGERAAFSKGSDVYLFLHHADAFIIFTPRVHTSGVVISIPARPLVQCQCRKISFQSDRDIERRGRLSVSLFVFLSVVRRRRRLFVVVPPRSIFEPSKP